MAAPGPHQAGGIPGLPANLTHTPQPPLHLENPEPVPAELAKSLPRQNPKAPRAVIARTIEHAGVWLWNKHLSKMEFGLYPKEYNFKVHGPYYPWRYYGKPDVAFKDLKMKEIPAWLSRRDKSVSSIYRAMARSYHYWGQKFGNSGRFGGVAQAYQMGVIGGFICLLPVWAREQREVKYMYHW